MKDTLIELIADLKLEEAEALADDLIKEGIKTRDLYEQVMTGLAEIGKKYEDGECFIADLIVSGMIAKNIFAAANLDQAEKVGVSHLGKVLFGTIYDDIHDIGKDLMIDALRNKEIEVVDLGVDVKVETFIDAVKRENPDIIAVSCVMTNSIPYLQELGKTLKKEKLLADRRLILGGAVVTQDYVRIPEIDFMTNNFYEGIRYIDGYLKQKREQEANE
ncbi:MAG: hypothetical protein PWP16_485 [Eubacteriaceae bacterium]|jgi:methanogenic corrinoid protein MtbC1|nr:hypothetical protein [Eubacteriaceae bacterium]MDK2904788.1 hypothetical protein [Eubacteriaceae bacterium]MDK2935020.1 hypothetical protein [Eubacteriaceae bacterium]MDK2961703.1 hypothetical protein [Eubacteriaceae bacterium]MDN5307122.1 hypothetical protein [Eubacteriaceae bacterium]